MTKIRTKRALAKKLGVSTPTLLKYLRMPGAPRTRRDGSFDAPAILRWIQANAPRAAATDDIKLLRGQKLALECERLLLLMDRERGTLVPTSVVVPAIARLWGELHALIRQKFEFELPARCAGRTAAECTALNCDALRLISARAEAGIKLLAS